MFTLLNILLLALLVLLVLLTAVSASMSGHPTADVDLKDPIPVGDNDWTGDGSPLAGASPGQYQPSHSGATLTMQAASTPK